MKKILIMCTSLFLVINISCLPILAKSLNSDSTNYENETQIYVDENYDTQANRNITPRNRGNCTDVYSRDWCNSHGYQNNRPVPGKVLLNDRERRCYFNLLASGTQTSLTVLVSGPTSALVAAPIVVFRFFNCLF